MQCKRRRNGSEKMTHPNILTHRSNSSAAAAGLSMGIMAKPAKRPLLRSMADLSSSLVLRQMAMGAEPSVGPADITCKAMEPASMSLTRSSPAL